MHEFGWTAKQWSELPRQERLLTISMIEYYQEEQNRLRKEAEEKAKS